MIRAPEEEEGWKVRREGSAADERHYAKEGDGEERENDIENTGLALSPSSPSGSRGHPPTSSCICYYIHSYMHIRHIYKYIYTYL